MDTVDLFLACEMVIGKEEGSTVLDPDGNPVDSAFNFYRTAFVGQTMESAAKWVEDEKDGDWSRFCIIHFPLIEQEIEE